MTINLSVDDRCFIEEMCARLTEECPVIGHLVAAINFKHSIVDRFGFEDGFEVVRECHLDVPGLDKLRCRRIVSLRSVAEGARFFRELWPGGCLFVHLAPSVLGESDASDQYGMSRSAYLTCLQDTLLRGRSAVILKDDMAIVDYENDELTRFQDSPEFDPGILHSDSDSYWTMEAEPCPREIDEAFMLTGSHTNDFGHWLTEYLPRLAIALMAGLPEVPILIDQHIPGSHRQSLQLFCPNSKILVLDHLAPCFVRKLWCASNPVYRGFYPTDWSEAWQGMLPDPQNFAKTIKKLKAIADPALAAPTGWDRIFLARKPQRKKRLVNHQCIEEIAIANGFKIIFPEDIPFVEQLRLVHHARHIVAPDGSNGLLCYFVSTGAKVCFLNHSHTRPLVELNGLLTALDASFTIVTGPVVGESLDEPYWNDYSINEKVFESFLSSWLHPAASEQQVGLAFDSGDSAHFPPVPVDEIGTASALKIAHERGGEIHTVRFSADMVPLEITSLNDVLYVPSALEKGQSLQIIEGKYLASEAVFDEFTAEFVKSRLLDKGIREFSGFVSSQHAGDVCILGNVFSRNFTHWHEELMKVVVIEQARLDCVYVISELPAFARELLLLMGIAPERILEVREPTLFCRSLFSTPVSYRNVADYPAVLATLRENLLAIGGSVPDSTATRLWLERGQQTRLGRKLVNEEEVHRLLERYGFQRLDIGALPIASQLAVAGRTTVMAGLHGSHFVHAQLMPEHSDVIECFTPLYLNPTYTEIYRILKHRYSLVCSTNTPIFPYQHGCDVLVDCQQFDLALRAATDKR